MWAHQKVAQHTCTYIYICMYMCVVCIHISVACELIKDLVVYEEVQHPLMTGLINLLVPAEKEEKEGGSSRQTSSGEVEQASSAMLLSNSVLSLFLHRSTSTDVHPASECSQGHWNVGCLQCHSSRRDGSGKPTLCIWQCYALYVCTHVYTVLVTVMSCLL